MTGRSLGVLKRCPLVELRATYGSGRLELAEFTEAVPNEWMPTGRITVPAEQLPELVRLVSDAAAEANADATRGEQ